MPHLCINYSCNNYCVDKYFHWNKFKFALIVPMELVKTSIIILTICLWFLIVMLSKKLLLWESGRQIADINDDNTTRLWPIECYDDFKPWPKGNRVDMQNIQMITEQKVSYVIVGNNIYSWPSVLTNVEDCHKVETS